MVFRRAFTKPSPKGATVVGTATEKKKDRTLRKITSGKRDGDQKVSRENAWKGRGPSRG